MLVVGPTTPAGVRGPRGVPAVVAGIGATVALVVAYRKQRDAEQARFDDRLAGPRRHMAGGPCPSCAASMLPIVTATPGTTLRYEDSEIAMRYRSLTR